MLVKHATEWQHALGSCAKVVQPTYPVVIQGIRVADWKPKNSIRGVAGEREMNKLRQENAWIIQKAPIEWMGWLSVPARDKKTGCLVVRFLYPEDANAAIHSGELVWMYRSHKVVKYDQECRVL